MRNQNLIISIVLSLAFITGCWFLSTLLQKKDLSRNVIEVKGLAEENFSSDLIVWSGSFTKTSMELKEAYKMLAIDEKIVRQYLLDNGVKENEMVFSSVSFYKNFEYLNYSNGESRKIFVGFNLSQSVRIESKDVEKIEKISREVSKLIDQDVEFKSSSPEYYYTKLADLKIKMIANATKDATERAEQIAINAKSKLGNLQQANLGIFQITAQNSSEEYSWGGTLNTSSKLKTASITMNLKFSLQ